MRNPPTSYMGTDDEESWDDIVPQVAGVDMPLAAPVIEPEEPDYVPAGEITGFKEESGDETPDYVPAGVLTGMDEAPATDSKPKSSKADKMEMWAGIISAIGALRGSPELGKAIQPFAGMLRGREDRAKADAKMNETIGPAEIEEAVNVYGMTPEKANQIKKSDWNAIVNMYERRADRESRDNATAENARLRQAIIDQKGQQFGQKLESDAEKLDKTLVSREKVAQMPRRRAAGGGGGGGQAPQPLAPEQIARLVSAAKNVPAEQVLSAYNKSLAKEPLSPDEAEIVDSFLLAQDTPRDQLEKYYGKAFSGIIGRTNREFGGAVTTKTQANDPWKRFQNETAMAQEEAKLRAAYASAKNMNVATMQPGWLARAMSGKDADANNSPALSYVAEYMKTMSGATVTNDEAARLSKITGIPTEQSAGKPWQSLVDANPDKLLGFIRFRMAELAIKKKQYKKNITDVGGE